jgi:hypothetical protein
MHLILVCAEDPPLVSRLKILLARMPRADQAGREVEVLQRPEELATALATRQVSLLILGRVLAGEDALVLLGSLPESAPLPTTLVLGGPPAETSEPVHLLADGYETRSILHFTETALGETPAAAEPAASRPPEAARLAPTGRGELAGHEEPATRPALTEAEPAPAREPIELDPPRSPRASARRAASVADPGLTGALEASALARAMFQCASRALDGALVVTREAEVLTLHLDRGVPVQLESSLPGDGFGRWLVARGKLGEAQYGEAAKRAVERGTKLGAALVDLGLLSAADLSKELAASAREQLVAC